MQVLHSLNLPVSEANVSQAIHLAKEAHESVMSVLENLHPNQDMRDRASVLEAMPPGTAISLGDLLSKVKMLKPNLVRILDSLMEEGVVQKTPTQSGVFYLRPGESKGKKGVEIPAEAAKNVVVDAHIMDSAPGERFYTDEPPSMSVHPDLYS